MRRDEQSGPGPARVTALVAVAIWGRERCFRHARQLWVPFVFETLAEGTPAGNGCSLYETSSHSAAARRRSRRAQRTSLAAKKKTKRSSPDRTMSAPAVAAVPDLSMLDSILDAPVRVVLPLLLYSPDVPLNFRHTPLSNAEISSHTQETLLVPTSQHIALLRQATKQLHDYSKATEQARLGSLRALVVDGFDAEAVWAQARVVTQMGGVSINRHHAWRIFFNQRLNFSPKWQGIITFR